MAEYLKEKIRAGIVGTGYMGVTHCNALRWNGVEVTGILGSSPGKSKQAAQDLRVPKAYHSFKEMIEDEDIQVVHLTTPNVLHYPHAKAALEAGKHVVCEKPLAMNALESGELVALGKKNRLVTAVNYNYRMSPMIQKAREMLLNGDLGTPRLIHGSYLQDWLLYPTDWNWRLDPKVSGQLRTVGDIGSHWIDLATFLCGYRILEVCANFSTFIDRRIRKNKIDVKEEIQIDTEDFASVLIHFENGVQGVFYISQMCAGHKNHLVIEINGSKSSLAWNSEEAQQLWIGNRDQENIDLRNDLNLANQNVNDQVKKNNTSVDAFNELYRRIYAYIRAGDLNKKPDFPTFEDGHYGMLVMEAIQKSAKEKTWIKVPHE